MGRLVKGEWQLAQCGDADGVSCVELLAVISQIASHSWDLIATDRLLYELLMMGLCWKLRTDGMSKSGGVRVLRLLLGGVKEF